MVISHSQDNVLLSHSAVLKYFMHSSLHKEASNLLNNVGHATSTGLPMCSATASCSGEKADCWFGTSSKQVQAISGAERDCTHREQRQIVNQSSSGTLSLLAMEMFA